jgi:hypothetical protein
MSFLIRMVPPLMHVTPESTKVIIFYNATFLHSKLPEIQNIYLSITTNCHNDSLLIISSHPIFCSQYRHNLYFNLNIATIMVSFYDLFLFVNPILIFGSLFHALDPYPIYLLDTLNYQFDISSKALDYYPMLNALDPYLTLWIPIDSFTLFVSIDISVCQSGLNLWIPLDPYSILWIRIQSIC